jgi:zinc D-Ala-D-Ala carboxypeptidase
MYKYFDIEEFKCSHTGANEMDETFLHDLDELRERCGFPFKITSGYRDPSHPIEAAKNTPGTHSLGIAADIAVSNGAQRYSIVSEALDMGFEGIGVAKGFVHVDARRTTPVLWSY